ncbi:hypothetical protein [Paenarthrobacter sp.]|uniref:hypothetical protein n=1 Tax=Paenarthrobacter sp. TaxID=1931993 RepID=UPI002811DB78|nr:hypothetical protein [Paenarthrobacter sp.]
MLSPAGAPISRGPFCLQPSALGYRRRGHNIHLRELGRRGMHLHGPLENIDDGVITFSDVLPERLATVEQRSGRAIDACISAAGTEAPEQSPEPVDDWLPAEPARTAPCQIEHYVWPKGVSLQARPELHRHASAG